MAKSFLNLQTFCFACFGTESEVKCEKDGLISARSFFRIMPHDPDPPPAKKFKPGSPFFPANKKPGMLLPKKGNAPNPLDVQRKQLPIYQAKSQLIDQLRQLHNAVLIGKSICMGDAKFT